MLVEAAAAAEPQAAREHVCDTIAEGFRQVGKMLWAGGYFIGADRRAGTSPLGFGDDATVGLAVVVQVAGELMAGAVTLLREGNIDAAAALVRQIVECEYLAWAFAEDEEEARAWMRSTRSERMGLWQPRRIRDRSAGRFRAVDYALHCERGGHPTPAAMTMLPVHSPSVPIGLAWLDLAGHELSTWRYVSAVTSCHGWEKVGAVQDWSTLIAAAVDSWRAQDQLPELAAQNEDLWRKRP